MCRFVVAGKEVKEESVVVNLTTEFAVQQEKTDETYVSLRFGLEEHSIFTQVEYLRPGSTFFVTRVEDDTLACQPLGEGDKFFPNARTDGFMENPESQTRVLAFSHSTYYEEFDLPVPQQQLSGDEPSHAQPDQLSDDESSHAQPDQLSGNESSHAQNGQQPPQDELQDLLQLLGALGGGGKVVRQHVEVGLMALQLKDDAGQRLAQPVVTRI